MRRLKQRRRAWGRIEPLPRNSGRKPKLSGDDLDRLKALVAEQPDAALRELRDRLTVQVDVATINNGVDLLRQVSKSDPGDKVKLTIRRDSKESEIEVELGTRP